MDGRGRGAVGAVFTAAIQLIKFDPPRKKVASQPAGLPPPLAAQGQCSSKARARPSTRPTMTTQASLFSPAIAAAAAAGVGAAGVMWCSRAAASAPSIAVSTTGAPAAGKRLPTVYSGEAWPHPSIDVDEETQGLGELVRRIQRPPVPPGPDGGGCPWSAERVPREFVQYAQSELLEIEEAISLLEAALDVARARDPSDESGEAEAVLTAQYFRTELAEEIGDLCFDVLCLIGLVGRQFGIQRAEPWMAAVTKMQERCCYVDGVGTAHPLPVAATADEAMELWSHAKRAQKARKKQARTTLANTVIAQYERQCTQSEHVQTLTTAVLPAVGALALGTLIGRFTAR
jgi:NTP pyrophosphatase (non-canonical NTP hydrolase)